jgi:2-polyprenyl-6-methoxyphenol hydroxylase-like FAD-dependent oxidoreductase
MDEAVVVGAGLGGLAAAAALRRRGWAVTVLERRPAATEPGAGIALWPNALRALDAIDPTVGAAVRAEGVVEVGGGIRDARGRWLVRTDTTRLARRTGEHVVVIERPVLHGHLRDALPAGVVRSGTPVVAVDPGEAGAGDLRGRRATVRDADGRTWSADLVVAADGLRSSVRAQIGCDAAVRATGTTAIRLVADVTCPEGGESWGRGAYVGLAPLPHGRTYLWAVVPTDTLPARAATDPEAALTWLRRRFGSWHAPVPAVLDAAEPAALLVHPLDALRTPRHLVAGRVALLGDAAHAMTPNLGQGAAQAFEDAAALAAVGLAGYDRARRGRVASVARRSWTAGRVAGLRHPVACVVRDTIAAWTPAAVSAAALERLIGGPAPVTPAPSVAP